MDHFDPFAIALCLGLSCSAILFVVHLMVAFSLKRTAPVQIHDDVPVSILKPLKGVDEALEDNLRAILKQDHLRFEVIFGSEDPSDPALLVARRLKKEHPQLSITIVSGCSSRGYNPKVRLLKSLLARAKHDWILVSDSNVRPEPGYLRAMQAVQSASGASLVHSRLSGVGAKGWGGRLEELQLNTWVTAAIQLGTLFRRPCVIGKSMLMRRTSLEKVGGFEGVEDVLAEDYCLGQRFHAAGQLVAMCNQPLPVMVGRPGLKGFFNRHVRWGQMRRHLAPAAFLLELFSNPTPLFFALVIWSSPPLAHLALFGVLLKWTGETVLYVKGTHQPSLRTIAVLPARDCLMPLMWCLSATYRRVNWRGTHLRVSAGSRLSPCTASRRATPRNALNELASSG